MEYSYHQKKSKKKPQRMSQDTDIMCGLDDAVVVASFVFVLFLITSDN